MRLKKLITTHLFEPIARRRLTLGTDVRLNDNPGQLELVKGANGYPLTDDLYAKTRLVKPSTMKQCIGFEASYVNGTVNKVPVTDVRFRLSGDGTEELFWDGAAWSTAAPGEWNSEAEVAAHIAAFPMAKRGIQVVLNLSTTDARFTPVVSWVKVLWTSDIEFQEDYVVRSFMPVLTAGLRPIAEYIYQFPASAGGTTVGLGVLETPYDIVGIDSVFDLSTDPDCLDDIYVSWNGGTKTVTLSAVASSARVLVKFIYRPAVALNTDPEYGEIAKIPAVNLESVSLINGKDLLSGGDTVLNKAAGTGWKLEFGRQSDIAITLRIITDKGKDLQRLSEAVSALITSTPALRSKGLDEEFTMVVDNPYAHATTPGQSGLQGGRITVRIINAVFYLVDAVQVHVATQPMMMGAGGNLQFG